MDAFTGEIRPMAFNYAPQNWMLCMGQTIPIRSNTALYSIIGTTYGGDGVNNFCLPNIPGVVLNGSGVLQNRTQYPYGKYGGKEVVTLNSQNMPPHNHTFNGATTTTTPAAKLLSVPTANACFISNAIETVPTTPPSSKGGTMYATTAGTSSVLNAATISPFVGGNNAHNNMQPYVVINYCICVYGEYPVRP